MHPFPALPAHRKAILGSALLAALLGMAAAPAARASAFHVNGDTLYYTGNVLATDPGTLEAYVLAAKARGTPLRQVVFRNSPGGAASGGVGTLGLLPKASMRDSVVPGWELLGPQKSSPADRQFVAELATRRCEVKRVNWRCLTDSYKTRQP